MSGCYIANTKRINGTKGEKEIKTLHYILEWRLRFYFSREIVRDS